MWTTEQRQRLYVEHETLQREGFTQFSVYHNSACTTIRITILTTLRATQRQTRDAGTGFT